MLYFFMTISHTLPYRENVPYQTTPLSFSYYTLLCCGIIRVTITPNMVLVCDIEFAHVILFYDYQSHFSPYRENVPYQTTPLSFSYYTLLCCGIIRVTITPNMVLVCDIEFAHVILFYDYQSHFHHTVKMYHTKQLRYHSPIIHCCVVASSE